MRGFIRVQRIKALTGECVQDTGFFPNKILTSGRNVMGTQASWMTHCHVGTDSTPPIAGHTGLLGLIATTGTITTTTFGAQGSAPFYGWKRRTFRFAVGATAAILSEVGVGWGSGASQLVSRALIIDSLTGLPTSVTPQPDEILDVTYEMRYYPPLSDVEQEVTLFGTVYETVTRAAAVAATASWAQDIGVKIGVDPGADDFVAYDGVIGTIETYPSGLTANCDNSSQFNKAYSNNSYTIGMQCNTGPTGWVLGAGIRCLSIESTAGAYQTSFAAQSGGGRIPKLADLYSMAMVWNITWFEGTIP